MSIAPSANHIQQHINLVKLAATYIRLNESRRSFRGKCPFHADQTESLLVSPEKNIFKCFGCGKEGGPIEFIMGVENLSLEEAVKRLS